MTDRQKNILLQASEVIKDIAGIVDSSFFCNYFKLIDNTTVLEKYNIEDELNTKFILDIISQFTRISIKDLKAKCRKAEIMQARKMYFYFAVKFLRTQLISISLQRIGKEVNKSHACVVYSIETADSEMLFNHSMRRKYKELEDILLKEIEIFKLKMKEN